MTDFQTAEPPTGDARTARDSYSEPVLHGLATLLRAPAAIVSAHDGQIVGGPQGYYVHDLRILSRLKLGIDGYTLAPVATRLEETSAADAAFAYTAPDVHFMPMEGPTCHLTRHRRITDEGLLETIRVQNRADTPITLHIALDAGSDLGKMNQIRSGLVPAPVLPALSERGLQWSAHAVSAQLQWNPQPEEIITTSESTTGRWAVHLSPGQIWQAEIRVTATFAHTTGFWPTRPQDATAITVSSTGSSPDEERLLRRSVADLDGLLLSEDGTVKTAFAAAGSPWYFTLFGRDSLWTARLLLPYAPWLAEGTLAVLAARQGTREESHSEEQPGRIPHEVRSAPVQIYGVLDLPPVYYGNIDATALWVCLLRDANLPRDQLSVYQPALRAALTWITIYGDRDQDGLVEYERRNPAGLTHQAWKDSATAIRFHDGRIARPPIATCEVQAYAYEALTAGADLLERLEDHEAGKWRDHAAKLAVAFRKHFWLTDEVGPYPAIALDHDKQPVTGAASNMAHLLGTGLVTAEEATLIATRLASRDLSSGHGLRTLSSHNHAYNPLSYHRGSVWPHDTAIAILGLIAEGHHRQARELAAGIVKAACVFGYRLPELYGGNTGAAADPLTAYPTACSPQAWSAAAGIIAVAALNSWNHPLASHR